VPADLFEPKGRLVLRRLVFRGCECDVPGPSRSGGSTGA